MPKIETKLSHGSLTRLGASKLIGVKSIASPGGPFEIMQISDQRSFIAISIRVRFGDVAVAGDHFFFSFFFVSLLLSVDSEKLLTFQVSRVSFDTYTREIRSRFHQPREGG